MSPKRASDLVKGIIVDLDAALASNGREALDERHSALASAMMLATRLMGGTAINKARIATALEKMEARHEHEAAHRDPDALDAERGSTDR